MASKELKKIREAVLLGRLKITYHAIEEMDDEELSMKDIEATLMSGKIEDKQKHSFQTKYRILGKSMEHEQITVVGKFTENRYFLIITVFQGE